MRHFHVLFPVAVAALVAPMAAQARETGGIVGTVEDADGLPVPNAEVVISGPNIAGERTAMTDVDGRYRIVGLAPGAYDLRVTLNGKDLVNAEVKVGLQSMTQVPLQVNLGGEIETIDVVFNPVIDMTDSSFSQEVTEEQIQNMPVGRSYQDVVNTLPGVTGRVDTSRGGAGRGNPSVRGEGQYGNNFFIDGVSTRDPATKTFGQNVNFDAIESIQVYTDGAPAEFGQFSGMTVNVVTKDGGDEHHGSAALFYNQHANFSPEYDIFDPETATELPTQKRRFRSPNLALTAGGPIIPEKLWYFGALTTKYDWSVPEGVDAEQAKTTLGGTALGKLTWFPTNALTLRYIFQGNASEVGNYEAGQLVDPGADHDRRDFTQSHLVTATLAPDDRTILEFRLGYTNINIDTVPVSGEAETPSRVDATGKRWGNDFNYDYNDRNRFGGGLVFTRIIDNFLGKHRIRAGAEYWFLQERREIINTGQTEIDWIDSDGNPTGKMTAVGTRYGADPDAGYPCNEDDYSDCATRTHWVNVGALGNTIHSGFAFVQDDWQPAKNLSINAGVRMDVERGLNDVGKGPVWQDVDQFELPMDQRDCGLDAEGHPPEDPECRLGAMVMFSPRIGFAFDPLNDGKTKISGHYGQYYDIGGMNLWQWANESSSNGFVRYTRDDAGEWQWTNTQDPVGHPLIYDKDLKPARMDKITLAIEREIVRDVSVSLRGILSKTSGMPEDVDVNLDDWYITNRLGKERAYRGLEVTMQKKWSNNWAMYGSYTLSESFGHTPGQFELAPGATSGSDGNGVGIWMDDVGEQSVRQDFYETGYSWLLEGLAGTGRYSVTDPDFRDDAGFYGYLPYHQLHQFKINGSYSFDFGTTIGAVYEFGSGHPWQKRTFIGFYGFDGMGQGRGSRRMPATHNLDFRVAQEFTFDEDKSLEVSLDVFNLPGLKTPITYYQNDAPGFGMTLYRQAPRSARLGLRMRY